MPNWCENRIEITGPRDLISSIWDYATDEQTKSGLLDAMHPMPKELSGTTAPSDGGNWYTWRIQNWGTKWDIDSEGLEFIDNEDGTACITGFAASAWSPPLEALSHFADAHEGVYAEVYYFEPGMAFVGSWDSAGVDDHYSYAECTSENLREHIPEYLVDYFGLDGILTDWEEEE